MNPIVERMPVSRVVWLFIFYIICHIGIGLWLQSTQKELEDNPNDKETLILNNQLLVGMKWFPAIYLIFAILFMYFVGW